MERCCIANNFKNIRELQHKQEQNTQLRMNGYAKEKRTKERGRSGMLE